LRVALAMPRITLPPLLLRPLSLASPPVKPLLLISFVAVDARVL
jgi:hypothetical protein